MTATEPAHPQRALVQSCPLVLPAPSHLLRLPAPTSEAGFPLPRCYEFPALPGARMRFSVVLDGDGLPCALSLPRQPLCADPPLWIAAQRFPLTSDLFLAVSARPLAVRLISPAVTSALPPRPSHLCRRWWWRCPSPQCRRRCSHLYLADDGARWACQLCCHLANARPIAPHLARALRRRGIAADLSNLAEMAPALMPPARPLSIPDFITLLRWTSEGKGRHRRLRR